jgi:prolyl oligopeptidase
MERLLLPAVLSVGVACATAPQLEAKSTIEYEPNTPAAAASAPDGGPASAPVATAPAAPPAPSFPATRREPVEETIHGQAVSDPFRWLEDPRSPEVQQWMKDQEAFARKHLDALPGRDALEKRFSELFYVESVGTPVKRGGRLFYLRQQADKEKAILYWREGAGPEKVVLDPNKWSRDGSISLGQWVPSWDGKWVAFQKKPNNSDEAILHVAQVESGGWSKVDVIEGAKYATPEWRKDGTGFYYEWLPPLSPEVQVADRPGLTEIRFHRLGTDPKTDQVIHPKLGDPKVFLRARLSSDGDYLVVTHDRGWNENDVYVKDVKRNEPGFKLMVKGKKARYDVDAWGGSFYVLTDEGAPRRRLFKVPVKKLERKSWGKPLIAEDKEALLQSFDLVGGKLALHYLKNAASELRIVGLDGKVVRSVALPAMGITSGMSGLPDDDEAFYSFSSFTFPKEVYRTSMSTGSSERWFKAELPIDPQAFTIQQVTYPSRDGTPVTMFLVHKKDLPRNGQNPVLLYGYGGFNLSMTPSFNSSVYPWVEAGGIYAMPNLRGGGEYGKSWHDAGRLHQKQNVFDDFIAAAEWLVKEGYTQAGKIAISGGSNGGLLVGAAMAQRPELFGAVLCSVPLLDMVRYPLFGSGKTWIPEYGDPSSPEDFKVLYGYSPYHQIKASGRYPPVLMLSADEDDRVDPMHARKFVALLQGQGSPAYLRVETHAGHGGADVVKKTVETKVDQYAFLFQQLGMKPAVAAGQTTPGNRKP